MLAAHVYAREGLVQDQNLWQGLQGQGHEDPLQLAAGKRTDALVEQCFAVDAGQALGHLVTQGGGDRQEHRPPADGGGEEI